MNTDFLSRQMAVERLLHLDFDLNGALQGIVRLAAALCDSPIAMITLLDDKYQHIKVRLGIDICRLPREMSFCSYTVRQDDTLVVPNAIEDTRFCNFPFVATDPGIRFYAGAPLKTTNGHNLGTLCVLDTVSRELGPEKVKLLESLAVQAMYLMELQITMDLLNQKIVETEAQNAALIKIAHIQSHEFRSPVANIIGLMDIIKTGGYNDAQEYLVMMEREVGNLDKKIHLVVQSTYLATAAVA